MNFRYIWDDRFGFIYNQGLGHTLIGEFGIKDNVLGSANNKWFEEFVKYMGDHGEGYSWTYWAWNSNSGDTGGIVTVFLFMFLRASLAQFFHLAH